MLVMGCCVQVWTKLKYLISAVKAADFLLGVTKNARSLIWCKLKTTVFTRSAFTFSESSYFLQLKIWYKAIQTSVEGSLSNFWQKLEFRDSWWQPTRFFFEKCTDLKQPYCFIKIYYLEGINFMNLKNTLVFINYVENPFYCTNREVLVSSFFKLIIALLVRTY